MQGKIIGNISNVYKIKTESKEYNAYARGKLKNNEITPLVGDNVEIQVTDEEKSEAGERTGPTQLSGYRSAPVLGKMRNKVPTYR